MMELIENNKTIIVQVAAGAVLALVLNWLNLPIWLIGGVIAAVVSCCTGKLVEAYDRQVAPRLKGVTHKDHNESDDD